MIASLRYWRAALVTLIIAMSTTAFMLPGSPQANSWQPRHHPDPPNSRVRPVVNLPSTQLPESIAFGRDGDMYLSLFTSGEILKIAPDGQRTVFATVPGAPTGVRLDRSGNVYVAVVDTADNAGSGVYRIPAGGGTPVEVAPVPGFPNGLAFGPGGSLYITESFSGTIYRLSGAGLLTTWLSSPLLVGTSGNGPCGKPHPFGPVGANGLAFNGRGDLFVTNTSVGDVVRVRVTPDGSAGQVSVFAGPACSLWGADGLAVDQAGNLYVAANAEEDIVRVSPRGQLRVLASRAAGAPLSNPSDVAFGPGRGRNGQIYISNFAFFHNGEGSGVVTMNVGVPGLPLPPR